jgi:hypothetical protein
VAERASKIIYANYLCKRVYYKVTVYKLTKKPSKIVVINLLSEISYKFAEVTLTREKLQAMEPFKDTYLVKLELLPNATTIDKN